MDLNGNLQNHIKEGGISSVMTIACWLSVMWVLRCLRRIP